jgi:hypothetical protein
VAMLRRRKAKSIEPRMNANSDQKQERRDTKSTLPKSKAKIKNLDPGSRFFL